MTQWQVRFKHPRLSRTIVRAFEGTEQSVAELAHAMVCDGSRVVDMWASPPPRAARPRRTQVRLPWSHP